MEEKVMFETNEQKHCNDCDCASILNDEADVSAGEEVVENSEEIASDVIPAETNEPTTSAVTSEGDMSCPQVRHAAKIAQKLESMESSATKTATEMRELHKLYHTEFAGRLKKMQDELDDYHEISKGRVFDGILSEIAKLYSDNEDLVGLLENKRLGYMFMDLMQVLETNSVHAQKSTPGEKRNTKYCQIIEQLPTDDPVLHDTVAVSLNTGFYVENRVLVKERIHVHIYKEPTQQGSDDE